MDLEVLTKHCVLRNSDEEWDPLFNQYLNLLPLTLERSVDVCITICGNIESLNLIYLWHKNGLWDKLNNQLFINGYGIESSDMQKIIYKYLDPTICDKCGNPVYSLFMLNHRKDFWCFPCFMITAKILWHLKDSVHFHNLTKVLPLRRQKASSDPDENQNQNQNNKSSNGCVRWDFL